MKMIEFRFELHWNLFPGVQLTKCQHWFRQWLDAEQATSHYLNQCWPSSLTHIYAAQVGRSINTQWPEQNVRYFAAGIVKCIFLNGNVWISHGMCSSWQINKGREDGFALNHVLYSSNVYEILLYNRQWVVITHKLICGVRAAHR